MSYPGSEYGAGYPPWHDDRQQVVWPSPYGTRDLPPEGEGCER